jgi:dihydrofolate reductase
MIKGIVCIGRNGELGHRGKMPWGDMPLDGRNFRSLTEGHTIVMGRKTWDSMDRAVLPNRKTIVLTRDEDFYRALPKFGELRGAMYIGEVLSMHASSSEDFWIIGGAEMYELFERHIQEIHVTMVDADFVADVFLPKSIFDELQVGVVSKYRLVGCKYDMAYLEERVEGSDDFVLVTDKVVSPMVRLRKYPLEYRTYKLLTEAERRWALHERA